MKFAVFLYLLAIGSRITYLLLNHYFGCGVTVTAGTPKSTVELSESNIAILLDHKSDITSKTLASRGDPYLPWIFWMNQYFQEVMLVDETGKHDPLSPAYFLIANKNYSEKIGMWGGGTSHAHAWPDPWFISLPLMKNALMTTATRIWCHGLAVAEELRNICYGGIPMAIGVQAGMATPAPTRFGLDELKTQFLVSTLARDFVACLGISEAGSGLDVTSIHVAKKIDKLGLRSSDIAQIFFEDIRVLNKNLIGEEGKGFTHQMLQFQEEQLQE